MKIVVIHNAYQRPGGEDVVVAAETTLLRERGHQVVTYFRSNHELDGLSKPRQLLLVKDIIHSDHSKRDVRKLLEREEPDLVHVHNTFMMISPSLYEACSDLGFPVVQTLHNFRLLCPGWTLARKGQVCEECIDRGLWRSVLHGCYRDSHLMSAAVALMLQVHRFRGTWDDRVDSYITLSDFARRKFIQGGLPAAKIRVKPNFVAPDPGEREKPGDYALFVGRLSHEKGISTLLAAWEKLHSTIPLILVGDGPLRESLQAEAAARNLINVSFRGWLPAQETRAAMKNAAFTITPSTCYEGFGMSIVESFACGTPVLCSALGGMQEIVDHHRTGLHFAPGNADELAARVEWAWAHPSRLASMGKEARLQYETSYTAEKNYNELMQIYQSTLHARGNRIALPMPTKQPPITEVPA
jgi:glycosyltransferase involved in cell wall biosynthesis